MKTDKKNYTYYGNGILEVFSVGMRNSDLEENEKTHEKYRDLGLNIKSEEGDILTEPIKTMVDFNMMEGISMFNQNHTELGEDKIVTNVTLVVFGNGLDLPLLMEYEDFKQIYFEYKGIKHGS